MTKISKTIVFFGNERLATGVDTTVPTLRRLIEAGYNVAAVVANHESSRSRNQRDLEIAQLAHEHNIPVLIPQTLNEIHDLLSSYNADIGVLVAFGRIIPQRVIDIFPAGIVNIHPSLLPLHRGPTPIESVILEGASETGVSIMQLVKAMDAGPIYAQTKIALSGTETKQTLADTLLTVGSDLLVNNIEAILNGRLIPTEQDDRAATYDALIAKEDGIIDWSKTAKQLEREIRAFASWPKSRTHFQDLEVVITEAHCAKIPGEMGKNTIIDKKPAVYCGEYTLVIDKLKPAGKQEMTGESFLAGYKRFFT